jgi:hypothetical protein
MKHLSSILLSNLLNLFISRKSSPALKKGLERPYEFSPATDSLQAFDGLARRSKHLGWPSLIEYNAVFSWDISFFALLTSERLSRLQWRSSRSLRYHRDAMLFYDNGKSKSAPTNA